MRQIKLPVYDMVIELDNNGVGTISSSLKEPKQNHWNAIVDGIEAMVLACACAGLDVENPEFLEAVETAVEGACNNI